LIQRSSGRQKGNGGPEKGRAPVSIAEADSWALKKDGFFRYGVFIFYHSPNSSLGRTRFQIRVGGQGAILVAL
jgi:hypothetical protein